MPSERACRPTSVATAASKSGCHGASRKVAIVIAASSFGPSAAFAANATAASSSSSSGWHAQASPISAARAVDALAEQQHRGRGLGPDRPFEHPRVAAAGVQADAEEARVESRGRAGETDVARERKVETGADRRTVDRGDRRQR
jgi:hypothetical protein